MITKKSVDRGQRYRDLSSSRFGVQETEWIVDAIFRGTDGIQYAPIVNAEDSCDRRFDRPEEIRAVVTVKGALQAREAAGDAEGQAIWKRIVEAILELLRDTPGKGEHVN